MEQKHPCTRHVHHPKDGPCITASQIPVPRPEFKIPSGIGSHFTQNLNKKRPILIDSTKPFKMTLDLVAYVGRKGDDYCCSVCSEVLVRIEPNGLFGRELNELDTTVILDHHLAKHPVP